MSEVDAVVGDAAEGAAANQRADRRRAALVPALRERVYATLVGLSAVAVLLADVPNASVGGAAAGIATSMGALWLAGMFADVSAHRVAYGRFPHGRHLRHIAWVSGQTLQTAALPLLSMAVAALGWWSLRTALIVAAAVLVTTIVLLGVLATRHTTVRLPVRLAMVAVEVAIAICVVVVKLLAH